MRRTAIAPCALLTLSLAVLVPATARAQAPPEPRIAAGVTAAGLDVSGLTLAEAAAKLYAADAPTLGQPIRVSVAGRGFALAPGDVGLAFDVNKSARRAYNAGLTAAGKAVDVPLYVTYDQAKLAAFANKVAAGARLGSRNATVRITLRHIRAVKARTGRSVKVKAMTAALVSALTDPRAPRRVTPGRRTVQPRVTDAKLPRAYPSIITIDRGTFTLRLFKRLKFSKRYPVAVGQPAYPTPTGLYSIANKQVNPKWSVPNSPWAGELQGTTVDGGSAANPLKARWMGIVNGVGIHGTGETGSIGTRASHGCIRMRVPDVIDLFARTPVGTPVLIGG
jgi:lipoprotein-anchoring transpeptidase ErfK/SrfK